MEVIRSSETSGFSEHYGVTTQNIVLFLYKLSATHQLNVSDPEIHSSRQFNSLKILMNWICGYTGLVLLRLL
jgi:hypothetical protein